MYSREPENQLPAQNKAQPTTPRAREGASISTERIMRAVEEQRRVSQQLEDLRIQQQKRTAHLRVTGLIVGILWCVSGALAGGFMLLLLMQPELLDRTLNALGDSIATFLVLVEQIRQGLSLIPSNNWLLSAAALVVVLLTGLWIRLMCHPQDV